jgi:uncharacterized protein YxjI
LDPFTDRQYLIRSKTFSFVHGDFRIFDSTGQLAFFFRKKAFRMKEDIRLYTDESMTTEVLSIQARHVIDFSATYDVVDSTTRAPVGSLRRKGLRSMIRDEWMVLDVQDRQIATIQEDSTGKALLRRFLSNLIPQSFDVVMNGRKVADIFQHFNPIRFRMTVDFSPDPQRLLDRRLGMAAAILLAAVEGRQDD